MPLKRTAGKQPNAAPRKPRARKQRTTESGKVEPQGNPASFDKNRPWKAQTPQEAKKRGRRFGPGEIDPNAPKRPEDRKRSKELPICGAPRTGKSSSGPGICCQPAGWGTPHPGIGACKHHGGNLPASIKKADRIKAAAAVSMYGLPLDIDPQQALLEEVQRTAGHVAWLGNKIAETEDEKDLTQRTEAGVQPAVWVEMYYKERDHLARVSKAAIDAGVAERQVRIQEEQGKLLAMVIQAVISDPELDLTPRQLTFAPKIIRRHLLKAPLEQHTGPQEGTPSQHTQQEVIDI